MSAVWCAVRRDLKEREGWKKALTMGGKIKANFPLNHSFGRMNWEGVMSSVSAVLQKAINDGVSVSVVYNGGSRPGQSRTLVPLSTSDTDLVAREPLSRRTKTFKLQKIASVSLVTGEFVENLGVHSVPPEPTMLAPLLESFEEYVDYFKRLLKDKPFNIIEEENYFAISGFFKNGRPKKTPIASIQHIDRTVEVIFNPETGVLEEHKKELTGRERPWRVDSDLLKQGKSFTKLEKAAELFLGLIPNTIRKL